MATITGTSARNILNGTSAADTINGLGGNDDLFGLGGNDTLDGGAGNDILDGGDGTDKLTGGSGDDTYVLGSSDDIVVENAGGNDTITSTKTRSLAGYAAIENLTLLGALAINGTGNSLNNVITGNSASNTLDGGGGVDRLVGGGGDDTYVVDSLTDVIVELAGAAGGSNDRIRWTGLTGQTFQIMSNVETLDLLGSAATNATGNSLANRINGNAGNNVLNGGAGIDTLVGGAGNDTYVLGSDADVVIDASGIDTVITTVSRFLASGIENLTLGGVAPLYGNGNSSDNTITGNEAANSLSGLGGADTLEGMAGNDTLIGGAGADALHGGSGVDLADYSAANSAVWLTLSGGPGGTFGDASGDTFTSVENVRGSNFADLLFAGTPANGAPEVANTMEGLGGNDWLRGFGGNDTLIGGSGNDTLQGEAGNDILAGGGRTGVAGDTGDTYEGGDGSDTVSYADATSYVGVNLAANVGRNKAEGDSYVDVENVIGSPFDDRTHDPIVAIIELRPKDGGFAFGGAGNDTLQAANGAVGSTLRGDAGFDILYGDSGHDRFWLQLGQGVDHIGSFVQGDDKFVVSAAEFGISLFDVRNENPSGSMAQFVFISAEGRLTFDRDGTGSADAIDLVTIGSGSPAAVTSADFAFI